MSNVSITSPSERSPAQPPDAAHILALGGITANFQHLELLIAVWTIALLKTDRSAGFMVTSQLSFKRLNALIGGLFRHRIKEAAERETMADILKRAGQLEERRNTFVHSIWGIAEGVGGTKGTGRAKITLTKDGSQIHIEQLSADEMNRVAADITALCKDLSGFMLTLVKRGLVIPTFAE